MSFYSDVEDVILHRSRESQGRFHLFKSSWYNIKHEPFTLRLTIAWDCQYKMVVK